jgi:ABC-type multidrug transport system fused ATPase/permease subunit
MAEPLTAAAPDGAMPRSSGGEPKLYASERVHLRFGVARSALELAVHQPASPSPGSELALIIGSLAFYLLMPWPIKILIDNVINAHPLTGIPAMIITPLAGDSREAILVTITLFLFATLILIGGVGEAAARLQTSVGAGGLDQAGISMNDSSQGESNWNGLFGYFETRITIDLTQRINRAVRTAVYERFLCAPLGVYADQKIGDAVFRAMNDSAAISDLLYQGIIAPLAAIAISLGAIIILWAQFRNEPIIPIAAAIALPLVAIGSGIFGRLFRDQAQRMRERGSDVMAAFEERLAHVELIKAFGQEERESAAINAASWSSYSATFWMVVLFAICAMVVLPLIALLAIAVIYHLMLEVIHGRITLGDVTLAPHLFRPADRPDVRCGQHVGEFAGFRRRAASCP